MKLKPNTLRKQIRFKNDEELATIRQAVGIISKSLTLGEQVTFSSFVRAATIKAALEVINKDQG